MHKIKRITPAEVVEAYRKTGMRVAQGEYVSSDGTCGCGMGVYAIAHLGVRRCGEQDDDFESIDRAIDCAGFTPTYQNGFAAGFDGDMPDATRVPVEPEYVLGFKDGRDAYEASKEATNV